MQFDAIHAIIQGVPHIVPDRARVLYDFVLEKKPKAILELGFAHGVSTCYMAAALQEIGEGTIVTIDLEEARDRQPNLEELLKRTGLEKFVKPVYTPVSYTWELMSMIEAQTKDGRTAPRFDFCFIDGAHSWEVDGFAFFLAEKLVKPGGWFLFDDMYWTYDDDLKGHPITEGVPQAQRQIPQIDRVFELLAVGHPNLDQFEIQGNWGWARKKDDADRSGDRLVDRIYQQQGIRIDLRSIVHKLRKRNVLRGLREGRKS